MFAYARDDNSISATMPAPYEPSNATVAAMKPMRPRRSRRFIGSLTISDTVPSTASPVALFRVDASKKRRLICPAAKLARMPAPKAPKSAIVNSLTRLGATGIAVLGTVSLIVSEPMKRRQRRGLIGFTAATVALLGSYGAGIAALLLLSRA